MGGTRTISPETICSGRADCAGAQSILLEGGCERYAIAVSRRDCLSFRTQRRCTGAAVSIGRNGRDYALGSRELFRAFATGPKIHDDRRRSRAGIQLSVLQFE